MMGYPSPVEFKNMLRAHMISICMVTPEDINITDKIFGLNIYSLKEKNNIKT